MTRLHPDQRSHHRPAGDGAGLGGVRTRWAAIGAAVAVTIGAAGIGGYTMVSADVSSGDRPVFVPITPCRLVDTRPAPDNVGVEPGPMGPGDTYVIPVRGNSAPCPATIAPDASGLSLNVTALNASERSFLTFWADGPNPGTANLNPDPGQPPLPNAVNTPLGSNGSFQMFNAAGTVDVVIDVNGYYVGHDHDDRYYTEAEADAAFAKTGDAYTKAEVDAGFAKTTNVYDRAQADGRFTQPVEVDNQISAAQPKAFTSPQESCTNDATGPGDANDGLFVSCASTTAGSTAEHNVLLVAGVGWHVNGASGYGECRFERNGGEIAESTVAMGETLDSTTQPGRYNHAMLTAVAGPFTGSASYSVACRERLGDPDWVNITMSVLTIQT